MRPFSVTRLGKISPPWKFFKVFGHFLNGYLVFRKIFDLLWQFYAFKQIYCVVSEQILNKYLAIRSHWTRLMNDTLPTDCDEKCIKIQENDVLDQI